MEADPVSHADMGAVFSTHSTAVQTVLNKRLLNNHVKTAQK